LITSYQKEKVFYTTDDIADMLGFHAETVREWMREGIIPAIKIRGRYRIRREDFERFLEEKKVGEKDSGA